MNDLIEQAEALLGRYQALTEHAKITPNAVILERIDIREAIIGMMLQLVEEIKNLQDFRKNVVGHFDCMVNQRDDLQEQLAAWQKIAIEERAQRIIDMEPEAKFDRYDLQECPQTGYVCDENDGYCVLSECPSSAFWRQMAAKELGLQVAQESGYLERLEKRLIAFMMDSGPGCTMQEAQDALEQIRKGAGDDP